MSKTGVREVCERRHNRLWHKTNVQHFHFVPKVKNFDSWKKESWIRPLNAKVRDKIHKNIGYGENTAEIATLLLLGSVNQYGYG